MKNLFIVHPFLFSVFPVLFLYSVNIAFFPIEVVFLPVALVLILALFLFVFLTVLLKDRQKAGILASFLLLAFFSYRHIDVLLRDLNISAGNLVVNANNQGLIIFLLWFLLVCLISYFLMEKLKIYPACSKYLNVVASFLVAISLIHIGIYQLRSQHSNQESIGPNSSRIEQTVLGVSSDERPDFYYIILDGYGRSDVLKDMYGYDNSEFIEYLSGKGFYVASQSTSNYMQTAISLASSLNFNYIDKLIGKGNTDSNNRVSLNGLINESEVVSIVANNGYEIIGISSGYYGARIKKFNSNVSLRDSLGEFGDAIIHSTPAPIILGTLIRSFPKNLAEVHRERILDSFEQLENTVVSHEKPQFVFAHIMTPHPPFVFGVHGGSVPGRRELMGTDGSHLVGQDGLTKEDYIKYYREQAMFVSERIQSVIELILINSEKPPIIILQADHGPGSELDWEDPGNTNFKERFSILNAYYLPDGGDENVYSSITPVNTFRVIFNQYFGTDYELLADKNLFSTWSRPYDFIDVTNEI